MGSEYKQALFIILSVTLVVIMVFLAAIYITRLGVEARVKMCKSAYPDLTYIELVKCQDFLENRGKLWEFKK